MVFMRQKFRMLFGDSKDGFESRMHLEYNNDSDGQRQSTLCLQYLLFIARNNWKKQC